MFSNSYAMSKKNILKDWYVSEFYVMFVLRTKFYSSQSFIKWRGFYTLMAATTIAL